MTLIKPAAPPAGSTAAMNPKSWRRTLALAAVVAGALLMWLSPETMLGALLMGAGIATEAIGIRLERG